jgi:hypothetical protein
VELDFSYNAVGPGAYNITAYNYYNVEGAWAYDGESDYGWVSGDSPRYGWYNTHPATNNVWGSTSGSNQLMEYVAVYSSSFPLTYTALGQAPWAVTPSGNNGSSGWVCASCSVAAGGVNGPTGFAASPVPVQSLSGTLQVWGPSFAASHPMGYQP